MLSYWLLAHTFTGWEFVQACTFSTSVVYALGVQRHCCKNISFNINVYSTFNITFVTKDLTVTISYRIWYTVLGKGLVPPFILYTVFIGMWGIVFFYPGIARWFKIVLFCFHHSISVDMIPNTTVWNAAEIMTVTSKNFKFGFITHFIPLLPANLQLRQFLMRLQTLRSLLAVFLFLKEMTETFICCG